MATRSGAALLAGDAGLLPRAGADPPPQPVSANPSAPRVVQRATHWGKVRSGIPETPLLRRGPEGSLRFDDVDGCAGSPIVRRLRRISGAVLRVCSANGVGGKR